MGLRWAELRADVLRTPGVWREPRVYVHHVYVCMEAVAIAGLDTTLTLSPPFSTKRPKPMRVNKSNSVAKCPSWDLSSERRWLRSTSTTTAAIALAAAAAVAAASSSAAWISSGWSSRQPAAAHAFTAAAAALSSPCGALGRDGEGGALAEAELRAHLVLEIPVDLGHVWPDLAPAERAGYSAGAASS